MKVAQIKSCFTSRMKFIQWHKGLGQYKTPKRSTLDFLGRKNAFLTVFLKKFIVRMTFLKISLC